MARLILEEAGARRRFKLNPGRLTIGSGDAATLTLQSDDVAELHAELLFEGGVATLVPRKGVLPPEVGGKAVTGRTVLADGDTITLGDARLSVEYDEGEGPARKTAPARTAAAPRQPGDAAAPARRRAAGGSAGKAAGKATGRASRPRPATAPEAPRIQRSRPRAKKGMPTWAILALFAVGLTVAFLAASKAWSTGTARVFEPQGAFARFNTKLDGGDSKGAREVLAEFEAEEGLSQEWRDKVAEMRAALDEEQQIVALGAYNKTGDNFLETQLKRFRESQLTGKPERPAARLFMKRSSWFLERYPEHDGRAWVERFRREYADLAAMGTPAELEDVKFEVRFLTQAKPRDYPAAYALIDEFLGRADGAERDEMLQLKASLGTEEKEFFDQQIEFAAISFDIANYPDKFAPELSIRDLIELIIAVHTPELQADAERRLFAIGESEDLVAHLQGYQRNRPTTFEDLMAKSDRLRAYARENGVLDG